MMSRKERGNERGARGKDDLNEFKQILTLQNI
jgi:hypothetical protein